MSKTFDLTAKEAGARAGRCHETMKRWARVGIIEAHKNVSGHWYFASEDVDHLLGISHPEVASVIQVPELAPEAPTPKLELTISDETWERIEALIHSALRRQTKGK